MKKPIVRRLRCGLHAQRWSANWTSSASQREPYSKHIHADPQDRLQNTKPWGNELPSGDYFDQIKQVASS